jgi:ribosomal protein L11 methyltransferase
MAWSELELEIARASLEEAQELLFALGSSGVQEDAPRQVWDEGAASERVMIRAWFDAPDRAVIEVAVARFGAVAWKDVPDVDWSESWKAGFAPFEVEGLVVAPPWDAPAGALVIEPGQGFGTGHHPTTRAVLGFLVELARAGGIATVLDVGCGSGILALAAAKLGLRARGIDIEPESVAEARANAARNGLEATFSTDAIAQLAEPADLVLANLHTEVLVELAPDLARLTRGRLVVGGILSDREARARAALDPLLELEDRRATERWVALRYRRKISGP